MEDKTTDELMNVESVCRTMRLSLLTHNQYHVTMRNSRGVVVVQWWPTANKWMNVSDKSIHHGDAASLVDFIERGLWT